MSDPIPNERSVSATILLVDDNASVRKLLVRQLQKGETHEVVAVESSVEARAQLEARTFDVVITDLNMPGEDGISLMQWGRERRPESTWIVLTGHGTMDTAVKALQLGAFDFLSKPFERTHLANAVRNALDHSRLRADRGRLVEELARSNDQLREHVTQLEDACALLSEQAQTIQADLQRAAIIQQALLPRELPHAPGLCVQSLYRPSEIVGGDLYDVVRLDEHRLGIMVADAAGHGLSAAMLAVVFRHQIPIFRANTRVPTPAAEALAAVNRSLLESFHVPGLFITAAYGIIDLVEGRVQIASAGHPPVVVQRATGLIERVYHTGPALGLYADASYGEVELLLRKGDRIFLHTDGLYDHLDREPAEIPEALDALLLEHRGYEPDLLQGLVGDTEAAREASGRGFEDDVTVLMVTHAEHESRIDNGELPVPPVSTYSPRHREAEILVGSDASRTCLSIHGKASWLQSAAFYDECGGLIAAGQDVLLDFALCDGVDSTFLGTIHELADLAERADTELRLQAVGEPVEHLFEELGMERVIDHMVSTVLPLPGKMSPLAVSAQSEQVQAERVLRAHERLAALGGRNRERFDPLIEQLRREIAGPPASGHS